MFQFPAFASSHRMMPCLQHGGLSHSEISASKVICTSTELIAAYHVLHRLREPRHPPCALSILPVVPPLIKKEGSIYIRLFDFCSTLNFSACINMSMNACNSFQFVENNGFEPLTPCLQSRCSSQLS